ncbi:MAG: glycine cleavage system protein GcvH [Deltaproteobacteria bacterium]|nr:glycine cleavage system protein GcvH [Deltaproteobacteria bacterium]
MKYFTKSHEWVSVEGNNATVGITQHARKQLGDIVYLELPSPKTTLRAGDVFGVIESVKAVSDLYAPVSGTVTGSNEELVSAPEQMSDGSQENPWLIKLTLSNTGELGGLLSAENYEKYLEEEVK